MPLLTISDSDTQKVHLPQFSNKYDTKNKNHAAHAKTTPKNRRFAHGCSTGYRYHLKGLTAKEIGKLLNISPRTFQRWKVAYQFDELERVPEKETITIQERAVQMANAGLSYSQIGRKLKRCKATIYNYVKAERQREKDSG